MIFDYEGRFYRATDEMNSYEKHVNAPYIRKIVDIKKVKNAKVFISGLGFYDLFINGQKITKGLIAPYISNPDDIVYFDEYDITSFLKNGKNCFGIILGNGMQNCPGGRVWDFDIARFRNVPCFAFKLVYTDTKDKEHVVLADESFKCAPSPILFDDLRSGCFYDARLEVENWNMPEFDDSGWDNVKIAENPRGDYRICEADPVKVRKDIAPVEVRKGKLSKKFNNRENMRLDTQYKFNKLGKEGIIFDFGVNTAGILRLKIKGKKGQEIFIQCCEYMNAKGEPSYRNTGSFYPDGYGQTVLYICKGGKEEIFEPSFTYFGYRYAVVFGLEEKQIKDDTLTMLEASSDLTERGNFSCSNETMNKLGEMARVSDLANFFYFPTDCPHREKNGWTGDAAASAEHVLLTLTPEKSYAEWLRNICKSQADDGRLPGIVPTGGWGFAWGNGPAWDNVLTELCWQMYRMRGDLGPAKECSESMFRYLSYISQRRRSDGLVAIGLGDWVQPMRGAGDPTAPLYLTDSVLTMYIAEKSADLFDALGLEFQRQFAENLYNSMRKAIRKNLIDFTTMTVRSRCQTAQAICIYYNVFDDSEKYQAGKVLAELVHEKDDHLDTGLVGIRTLFHVLSDCGYGDLAFKLITREDFPSYGMMVKRGLTSIAESFESEYVWENEEVDSQNHHFLSDFVSWFIQDVVGIKVNPRNTSPDDFDICPDFLDELDFAKAHYDAPCGKVSVEWKKKNGMIEMTVKAPKAATGYIVLNKGYTFVNDATRGCGYDGCSITPLKAGKYTIK